MEKEIPCFTEIYKKYESLVRMEHKLDFDDMMLLCHKMLSERQDILEEYKEGMKGEIING